MQATGEENGSTFQVGLVVGGVGRAAAAGGGGGGTNALLPGETQWLDRVLLSAYLSPTFSFLFFISFSFLIFPTSGKENTR